MIYHFIATAPCQILIKGERKNLRGGDVFTINDDGIAAQLRDYNHSQHKHLRLLSTEGTLDEPPPESSRGEQILQMISGQADAEVMVEPVTTKLKPEPELEPELSMELAKETQEEETPVESQESMQATPKRRRKAAEE